jgi:molybdate/tungstate transport system substrate-binding protein
MNDSITIAYAGSLSAVIAHDLAPAFASATGQTWSSIAGPAVGLANRIRTGEISPDVYMSADAEVNRILMEPATTSLVQWFLVMARTRMVLAYSPKSRFAAELAAAASGALPWHALVQRPGFVLWRTDPRTDPGGYRALFVCQLAETYYGLPGLADRLLGGDHNDAQIGHGPPTGLATGEVDAMLIYVTVALQLGLPYLQFPEEIDLSNPRLTERYRAARFTNPLGQTFSGTPAVYSITIPTNAHNPTAAEAFVSVVLSEAGQQALARHGFLPAAVLAGGDIATIPPALQPHIQGRYAWNEPHAGGGVRLLL